MKRFIEIVNETNFNPRMERTSIPKYSISEVWINEDYVVSVREAKGYKTLLLEGLLPEGLENAHTFTSITTNNGSITETHVVVGSPISTAQRFGQDTRTLLKG